MPDSRYISVVPNFTPAAGDFIVPNSDTVTSNFVLQGDNTGGGTWVTIPVTEYELFPKSGFIAQRSNDYSAGTGVDWSTYETANGGGGYRLHAYTKSVSMTRTTYADQTVTFAEDGNGYSPIGQVGELNGEAIKNIIANFVIAGGADVVINDSGITFQAGQATTNSIKWASGSETPGLIWADFGSHLSTMYMASQGEANVGLANSEIQATGTSGYNTTRLVIRSYAGTYGTVGLRGWQTVQFTGDDLTKFGLLLGGTNGDQPSALLHLKTTAPSLLMEDTTSSAKSLYALTDGNLTKIGEYNAGTPNYFVGLDLANQRVGIGNTAPAVPLDVTGEIRGSTFIRSGGQTAVKSSMKSLGAISNNGVAQVATNAGDIEMILLFASNGTCALFSLKGGANDTVLLASGGTYSKTAGTAGTNVYWSAGNSRYEIENKTGGSVTYEVVEWMVG